MSTANVLRREFPDATHWEIKLLGVLVRDGHVSIACRDRDVKLAVLHKLCPDLYPNVQARQSVTRLDQPT